MPDSYLTDLRCSLTGDSFAPGALYGLACRLRGGRCV